MPDTKMSEQDSFLHEAQKEGKATGKVEIKDLDAAIASVCHVMNEDVVKKYKKTKEEDWPTTTMQIYCHDCRSLVPGSPIKLRRGKTRLVCGTCGSKKISSGREESLAKFYRIDEKKKEEEAQKEETKRTKPAPKRKAPSRG